MKRDHNIRHGQQDSSVTSSDGKICGILAYRRCGRDGPEHCSTVYPARAASNNRVTGVICGFVVGLLVWWLFSGDHESSAESETASMLAFVAIADAHGEYYRTSAMHTASVLADLREMRSDSSGVELDQRILDFARMQAEYERAMAAVVATESEAVEHPQRVPLNLWRLQLEYHQEARRLAATYLPAWVEGLDMRIEHDETQIRTLQARN